MNSSQYLNPSLVSLPTRKYRVGPHRVALVAAIFTFPLLFLGGSVTTYRVGLAVPDWPQTFGINMFLYDFWNAPFGVQVEHLHRLYAAAVGLATIILCGWFLISEPRRWVKAAGVLALFMVILQGILGGLRVTRVSTFLAAVHGITGQVFFGFIVTLVVVTGRSWLEGPAPLPDSARIRRLAAGLPILVYIQVSLGAWVRHFGSLGALAAHALVAAGVIVGSILLLVRIERRRADLGPLVGAGRLAAGAALLQVAFGIAALIFLLPWGGVPRPVGFYEAVVRTGHQTNAALLIAASLALALRSWRFLGPSAVNEPGQSLARSAGGSRELAIAEVVA
jgi:cytochrome c oxidase assembly protein subunit 15